MTIHALVTETMLTFVQRTCELNTFFSVEKLEKLNPNKFS